MNLASLEAVGFDVATTNHADAILSRHFPAALAEFCRIMIGFEIRCAEMLRGGGNECSHTKRLGDTLKASGWLERSVEVTKTVDGVPKSSMTHKIDHVKDFDKGTLALEIEWNNKDPFFDRDLENYQRLHAEGAMSAGIIITRGQTLNANVFPILVDCAKANGLQSRDDFARLKIKTPTANQEAGIRSRMKRGDDFATAAAHMMAAKYGESTTHWGKLILTSTVDSRK